MIKTDIFIPIKYYMMKNLLLLSIFLFVFNIQSFSQVDEDLIVLEQMFDQQRFDEMINYKSKKIKKLSAKSLFYKGMAFFSKEDDKNAFVHFDLAIKKGPADENMYFYRGLSLYYLKKYKSAIIDFQYLMVLQPDNPNSYSLAGESLLRLNKPDSSEFYLKKAIELPNCDPQAFINLATIYQEKEEYEEALAVFNLVINKLQPHEEKYKICAFNMGLIQQELGLYDEAQKTFEKYTALYQDDYQAISKLVQIYNQKLEYSKTPVLVDILYKAYSNRQLPSQMKQMFCFDQFQWSGKSVLAFENFDENVEVINVCKHKFYILDKKGEIDFIIQSVKDTLTILNKADSTYMLKMVKNDTLSVFNHYLYNSEFEYPKLKTAVLQILEKQVIPVFVIGEYGKICAAKRKLMNKLTRLEKDGSSFENAILVKSISEEYEWLGKYYPGHIFLKQQLIIEKKMPYDVIEIKTIDGELISIYFDISIFFGRK